MSGRQRRTRDRTGAIRWGRHRLGEFGAGGRLGVFLGDHFSIEADGNVSQPLSRYSGVGRTTAAFGSASLVISSGGLYILGGYSRLHMGPNAQYASDLNAVHAGLGGYADKHDIILYHSGDHQDFIGRDPSSDAPEPGPLALIGAALIAMLAVGRRRDGRTIRG